MLSINDLMRRTLNRRLRNSHTQGEVMDTNQVIEMIEIVESNKPLMQLFDALDRIGLENYYVGAGAVAQSVWNSLSGYQINHGLSDIDIVYFDDEHLEDRHEQELKARIEEQLVEFPLWIDLKNQARVHLWYHEKFGYEIQPYESLENAINTWPTTATSLGLRRDSHGEWTIYAPFGIEDIFDMRLKANARQITEEIYMKKVKKWMGKWPSLVHEPWSGVREPIIHEKAIRFSVEITG